MKNIKDQIYENIDKIPELYRKIVLRLLDIGSIDRAKQIASKHILLTTQAQRPKKNMLAAVLHGEIDLSKNQNADHVLNDLSKLARMQDPIFKKLNAEMATLYDESKYLKSRKLTHATPKEERKEAAFRILEIHEKLLPPLYKERYDWINFGIIPSKMKVSEPRPEDWKEMPSIDEVFRLINRYRVQISRNRNNKARKDELKFWKTELAKLLGFVRYYEKNTDPIQNAKND